MPMRRRAALVTLISTVLALGIPGAVSSAQPATSDLYVSPSGNDHANGTARHPVRTLERARGLVRERVTGMKGDLTVHLASGTYRRTTPLTLDARDSGTGGHQVIWHRNVRKPDA